MALSGRRPAVAHRQVINHRGGHDGDPGEPHIEPPAPLFQVGHGAPGGVQPEGAAPGDADALDFLHDVQAHQGVHLAGAGGGTPDIGAAHGLGGQRMTVQPVSLSKSWTWPT